VLIQAVCLDLFHTLIDVARVPDHVGAFTADILGVDREAWNEACFSPHHPIITPSAHIDVIRRLAHSLDPDVPEARIREAVAHRQRRFDHALTRVDSGTLQALHEITSLGLPLALVSNASTAEVSAWPDSPLRPYFQVALFSCAIGLQKPDPAIYHRASRELGVAVDNCLFVGDGGSDEHRGARRAGMVPVMVGEFISAAKRQARRPHCDFEVESVRELPSLLQRLRT